MNRSELETELVRVGKESMCCERKCEGVRSSILEGICPRYVTVSGSGDQIGSIIVSLASPRTSIRDRKLLVATKHYEDMLEYCRGKVESTILYSKLDSIRTELGLRGAAVWTTLCKCERIKGEALPSKTVQTCAESYLAKELGLVDKSVPILAVGNRVFDVIRHSFPERFVLNIPSPDGQRGDFQKTVDNEKLLEFAKAQMAKGRAGALCLCPSCARKHLSTNCG